MRQRKYTVNVVVSNQRKGKQMDPSERTRRIITYHSCSHLVRTFEMLDARYNGEIFHPVYGYQTWQYATVFDKETREELARYCNLQGQETRPKGQHEL